MSDHDRVKGNPSGSRNWIERVFSGVVREFKHHTDPTNHQPIHIEPVTHPVQRTMIAFTGFGMLGLAGIGAIMPIMPTWPFALVALFCFARSSSRVRNWMVNDHVIKSVMSLVHARPEKPFVWVRRCLDWLSGSSHTKWTS